jgi:hypothetical protein
MRTVNLPICSILIPCCGSRPLRGTRAEIDRTTIQFVFVLKERLIRTELFYEPGRRREYAPIGAACELSENPGAITSRSEALLTQGTSQNNRVRGAGPLRNRDPSITLRIWCAATLSSLRYVNSMVVHYNHVGKDALASLQSPPASGGDDTALRRRWLVGLERHLLPLRKAADGGAEHLGSDVLPACKICGGHAYSEGTCHGRHAGLGLLGHRSWLPQ